jgi:hypothetical protein
MHGQWTISRFVLGNIVYGPLSAVWDEEKGLYLMTGKWRDYVREPLPDLRKFWGENKAIWPCGAACSTFAGIFAAVYTDAGAHYKSSWGTSMVTAIKKDAWLQKHVTFTAKGDRAWYRTYEWDKLPKQLPESISFAVYKSHIVLAVDADALELVHPKYGDRIHGIWVLGADGWFVDKPESSVPKHDNGDPDDKDDKVRLYNCQPLTFEPAADRAKRQKDRPDEKRKFALVGLKCADPIPVSPRLIISP